VPRRPGPAPDPLVAERRGRDVDTDDGPWGLATATFSRDRSYRFRLSRVWDRDGTRVNFLMLNPSTADAFVLDPTVRRCAGFAESWEAGAFEVTNIFALRSTDPRDLRRADDPIGRGNDDAIVAAAECADLVVCAWGAHGTYLGREAQVRDLLQAAGTETVCLRRTRAGHPGHPLYVRKDVELIPWA